MTHNGRRVASCVEIWAPTHCASVPTIRSPRHMPEPTTLYTCPRCSSLQIAHAAVAHRSCTSLRVRLTSPRVYSSRLSFNPSHNLPRGGMRWIPQSAAVASHPAWRFGHRPTAHRCRLSGLHDTCPSQRPAPAAPHVHLRSRPFERGDDAIAAEFGTLQRST